MQKRLKSLQLKHKTMSNLAINECNKDEYQNHHPTKLHLHISTKEI